MSIKQMSLVWERAATDDPSTLLVLLALADWANDDGVCWPAIESIAEKCRISERTAQRIIKHLEVCELLEVTRKRGRKNTNTYKLKVPTCQVLFDLKPVTDDTFLEEKVSNDSEKVSKPTIKGDTAVTPEPSEPSTPEPSKTKRAKTPKPKTESIQIPESVPITEWREFLNMRDRIRKPATPYAQKLVIRELERLNARGHPPAEVLNQSIKNSWQDVYELKGKSNAKYSGNRPEGVSGSRAKGAYHGGGSERFDQPPDLIVS